MQQRRFVYTHKTRFQLLYTDVQQLKMAQMVAQFPVLLRYLNYTPDAVILLFYNKLREILDKISRRRKATA